MRGNNIMSTNIINPWEIGSDINATVIPSFCKGTFIITKIVPPKDKTVRDGLVAHFIMTSYIDEYGKKVELVEARETTSGYQIDFPLGKRGLKGTKFRGPKNTYRFINPATGKWFQISQDKLTPEYAMEYLPSKIANWSSLTKVEQDAHIDEYLEDMFMFGLSQDLALPMNADGTFTKPIVGLKTDLYRVYTAAAEGEKYPNIKITKWEKGKPSLDGEHSIIPEQLALAIEEKYAERENQFDPSTYVESNDEEDII